MDTGYLENFRDDLLFSMVRLSASPYSIRRLNTTEEPAFQPDVKVVSDLTGGQSLAKLLADGNLFYVDHSPMAKLHTHTDRYRAVTDAFFYINSTSHFSPLAIRAKMTNSTLIYTPQDATLDDQTNDWLLAKMMFSGNDFYFSQIYHLAATHNVVDPVYEVAIRTLSDDHPIMGLMKRSRLHGVPDLDGSTR